MKDTKRTIELWSKRDFLAFIVEEPSGVVFTNQTGGCCCRHPEIEGRFLELPIDLLTNHWVEGFGTAAEFLKLNPNLERIFEPLSYDLGEPWVGESEEAWVRVRVREGLANPYLAQFAGMSGVITYENSD